MHTWKTEGGFIKWTHPQSDDGITNRRTCRPSPTSCILVPMAFSIRIKIEMGALEKLDTETVESCIWTTTATHCTMIYDEAQEHTNYRACWNHTVIDRWHIYNSANDQTNSSPLLSLHCAFYTFVHFQYTVLVYMVHHFRSILYFSPLKRHSITVRHEILTQVISCLFGSCSRISGPWQGGLL